MSPLLDPRGHVLCIVLSQQGSRCSLTSHTAHPLRCWWVDERESFSSVCSMACEFTPRGRLARHGQMCDCHTERKGYCSHSLGRGRSATKRPAMHKTAPQKRITQRTRVPRLKRTPATQQPCLKHICPRKRVCMSIRNTQEGVQQL